MIRAFALSLIAMFAQAAHAATPLTQWDGGEAGKAKTYAQGGYKLTLSAKKSDGLALPSLTVNAPGLAPITIDGQPAGDIARAAFGVVKLSPTEKPSVIFTSFSGGAHCCTDIVILQPTNKGWAKIDLGGWNGEGLSNLPSDVDGDGKADIVLVDNAFLYTFASYADSWAPPKIFNIVHAKAVDVSAEKRYVPLFRADMAKAKDECGKGLNGACASYAASAARVGAFDLAWTFVLSHYDRKSDWDYPTRCTGKMIDGQCKGGVQTPKDFPQSLKWFLVDNQYLAP